MKFNKFIIFLGAVLIIVLFAIYGKKKFIELNLNSEIIGIIENVSYDVKQIPLITVNGSEFYLNTYGIRKSNNLVIGDSLYKGLTVNFYFILRIQMGIFVF